MNRPASNTVQKTLSPFKNPRLAVRLSQEQLAAKIGVATSTIRRWEKGQAEPTMTVAQMPAGVQRTLSVIMHSVGS